MHHRSRVKAGLHSGPTRGSAPTGVSTSRRVCIWAGWADPLGLPTGGSAQPHTRDALDTTDTVNKRVVRILLECILVLSYFTLTEEEKGILVNEC